MDEDSERELDGDTRQMLSRSDSASSDDAGDLATWTGDSINPRPPALKERVGPFEVLKFLGRGGMGQVFLARDSRLDRLVALKLLMPGPPAFEQRFQREARAQAKIQHDGVCNVLEVGAADGRPYIAMQYLEGQTLSQCGQNLTLEEKVSVIRQVAEAIHAAHLEALVHRDLKPSNIMVHRVDGSIKAWVLDFGMVQESDGAQLTMTGEVMGTPYYMAPEQVRGDHGAIDRRTDIYGLGAISYEILTGELPIAGENVLSVLSKVETFEPAPPRQHRPDIPPDLEWIVLRCLEKEPHRRYRSALELIEDLERFRQGEPVQARRSSLAYRLSKQLRKNRQAVIAGLVAALVLGGVAWRDFSQRRATKEELRLTSYFLRQVEEVQWHSRIISTLPLHDTRPERNRQLQRLGRLEEEIRQGREMAEGPGNFALGRGYQILGEDQKSFEFLERAWESGYRDPHLSFSLGLAYGKRYVDKLYDLTFIPDPEARNIARQKAEALYKVPSMELLDEARISAAESSSWLAAKLAIHEERWQAAVENLDAVKIASPWRYEATTEQARVSFFQALEKFYEGKLLDSLELLTVADEQIRQSIRAGESDPATYHQLCLQNKLRVSISDASQVVSSQEELIAPCLDAIQADSGSPLGFAEAAALWQNLGDRLRQIGDPASRELFENAINAARQALLLDPRHVDALSVLSRVSVELADLSHSPDEADRYLKTAFEHAEHIREIEPDAYYTLFFVEIGIEMVWHLGLRGADAELSFQRTVEAIEPLLDGSEPSLLALMFRTILTVRQIDWRLTRGIDFTELTASLPALFEKIESSGAGGEALRWLQASHCIQQIQIQLAKREPTDDLPFCREVIEEQVQETPRFRKRPALLSGRNSKSS